MSRSTWLSLGFVGCVVVACGGNVSLGDSNSGLSSGGSSGGSSSSSGGGAKDCSAQDACGPALGMPVEICPDGSTGGNTGRCIAQPDGSCGWEIRACPPAPPACFDAGDNLNPLFKKCSAATDCLVVDYQQNCCGTMHAAGVNKASEAAVKKCAADRAAGFPACGCATLPTSADDGSSDPGGSGAKPAVTCNTSGLCETTFKGTQCGKYICTSTQTCCSGLPLPEPTCVEGTMCPVSQRKHKKDIRYLSEADKQTMSDELLGFRLATYRYKSESSEDRTHLGFIIDDVAPSPAVTANGERVDMYGYQTMSVAALQVQAREIAELRKQIEDLKRELARVQDKRDIAGEASDGARTGDVGELAAQRARR